MTLIELARLIRLAREVQKAYFRTRSQPDLIASRTVEARSDRVVAEILDPPTLPLFGEADPDDVAK
jgi:hypothetical protein